MCLVCHVLLHKAHRGNQASGAAVGDGPQETGQVITASEVEAVLQDVCQEDFILTLLPLNRRSDQSGGGIPPYRWQNIFQDVRGSGSLEKESSN